MGNAHPVDYLSELIRLPWLLRLEVVSFRVEENIFRAIDIVNPDLCCDLESVLSCRAYNLLSADCPKDVETQRRGNAIEITVT